MSKLSKLHKHRAGALYLRVLSCCGAPHHTIALTRRGCLVLLDHTRAEIRVEQVVAALGGMPCPCVRVLYAWRFAESAGAALLDGPSAEAYAELLAVRLVRALPFLDLVTLRALGVGGLSFEALDIIALDLGVDNRRTTRSVFAGLPLVDLRAVCHRSMNLPAPAGETQ